MRVHLLALPYTQTTRAYALDGFCTATRSFARVLKLIGAHVTLYASEECDVPVDELVTVITKEEIAALLEGVAYQYAGMEGKSALWSLTNPRLTREIGRRKQPKDFICTIGGVSQKPVTDAHPDLMAVEYSIGYVSSYAPYRVFESHVWRHCTHGYQDDQQGRFFDTVIPYFFDPQEFPFRERKEDFALYVGRLTPRKGIEIACMAAKEAGVPLKVIGHGDRSLVTHGAEYLGALSDVERNDWMSRARALLAPMQYLEPFGSVVVEAQMCGTPVITTDFGAFVETVEDGRTGFRCNILRDFVRALHRVSLLDPATIRRRAIRRYSLEAVAPQYAAYFDRLLTLWDRGWMTTESNHERQRTNEQADAEGHPRETECAA